jgi:hypothetical protein
MSRRRGAQRACTGRRERHNEGWWCLDALRLLGNALVTPTTSDDGDRVSVAGAYLLRRLAPVKAIQPNCEMS